MNLAQELRSHGQNLVQNRSHLVFTTGATAVTAVAARGVFPPVEPGICTFDPDLHRCPITSRPCYGFLTIAGQQVESGFLQAALHRDQLVEDGVTFRPALHHADDPLQMPIGHPQATYHLAG